MFPDNSPEPSNPAAHKQDHSLKGLAGSKKQHREVCVLLTPGGLITQPLSAANAASEIFNLKLSPEIARQVLEFSGAERPIRNHLPLTDLSLRKNFIAQATARGHLTFLPKGQFIVDAIEQAAGAMLQREFRCLNIRVPSLFAVSTPQVASLTDRFGSERFNRMVPASPCTDRGASHYLRYAADPDLFNYLQGRTFDFASVPIALLSPGETVRNDPEDAGLLRTMGFFQPDFHVICDRSGYHEDWMRLHQLTANVMRGLFPSAPKFLVVDVVRDFLQSNPGVLQELSDSSNLPVVANILREMNHYYSVQIQYCLRLTTGHYIQTGNLQLDFKNSGKEIFDIGIERQQQRAPCVIVHALLTGRDSRVLAGVLNERLLEASGGHPQTMPPSLSPYQVRFLPVSSEQNALAFELSRLLLELSSGSLRVMVDDRDLPLGEKVKQAGMDWVPYTIAIGPRDMTLSSLVVNNRYSGEKIRVAGLSDGSLARPLVDYLCQEVHSRTPSAPLSNQLPGLNPFANILSYSQIPAFLR